MEEDHIPANTTCIPIKVSKLDHPAAVKRPPARYVDICAAEELMSNASGGFG
jgi:hypothetical protein